MHEVIILDNALRVVFEPINHTRSAAIGVWVKAGALLEDDEETGLSHLMEHMSFKGTKRYSVQQLAGLMDMIGGQVNAATSKLYTTYYARVTEGNLKKAADLLAELVLQPLMAEEELNREKNVVLEEINMTADNPEDAVDDLINEALYSGQPLAKPILGRRNAIAGYTREDAIRFRDKFYHPANTVISVAGQFKRDEMLSLLNERFGTWQNVQPAAVFPAITTNRTIVQLGADKPVEQVYLCLGYKGLQADHPDSYALLLMNAIYGGAVSSRLFQRIREQKGLVYNIYSAPSFYPTCGDFVIYAAVSPANAEKVLQLVDEETESFLADGVTNRELRQAKEQMKTGYVLAQESAYQRMTALGSATLLGREIKPARKVLAGIERVTKQDVHRIAVQVLGSGAGMAFVGKDAEKLIATIRGYEYGQIG